MLLTIVAFLAATLAIGPGLTGGSGPAQAEDPPPREIKASIHQVIPFVEPITPGQHPTGFSIDLWNEIARRNNWTTTWVPVPDVKGQLDAVRNGDADAAVGAVSITSERTNDFDFSQPFYNAGLQILVPANHKRGAAPTLMGFLRLLFTWPMLLWLGTAAVLGSIPAILYWLSERRHPDSDVDRKIYPGLIQSYRRMFGSMVGHGNASPRHPITVVLVILWAFVTIVFTSFYTANLSAHLTMQSLDGDIQTPQDLGGKSVATIKDSTGDEFLKGIGIDGKYYPTNIEAMEAVRDRAVDAAVLDAPVEKYYAAHDGAGKVQTAGVVFEAEDYGFGFPANSELRRMVNNTLLAIREDGTYDRIKTGWFGDENTTANSDAN